ncbi:acylglycerol kinase family protein [Nesterenkonia pannonica]|uniref:diacylglycerol/lipid kinase family protein n=1 Tax=Nesterenkonia pannonica TaxID=1548602 RepID=UPI002164ED17|nr:acylglycerol kinase family protein [Nesterenkonia pannonica]
MTLVGAVLNVTKEQAPEAVRLIEFTCYEAGMETPLVMASTAEDPGHVMTRRALDAGCDVVLAVGGDGTVRAVAAELAGTSTPMGVVPMGTGNLFARNIGLPHDDLLICVHEAIHGTPTGWTPCSWSSDALTVPSTKRSRW